MTIDDELNQKGYTFLGWQNGWGNKRDVKYINCLDQNHKRKEIQHNRRGSENTVICDICKIYWKYDCSD